MKIKNYFKITDNICTSGQPSEQQFKEIASKGYEAVINLAMPDSEHSLPNEGKTVTSLGLTYIHIPVPFESPETDHIESFSGYMNVLKNKKVWVHCIVNARVSAFLYCYLQKERGLSQQEATTPLLTKWLPTMDSVWKDFIADHEPKQ